ncbi:Probable carboxylesterase 9 [Striga hermonthica]|uniref:Probable carboxylesterase 9 n=1 Tax=Striga hermonthica TaxID=68872 RepID=A0A9N7P391_STRHE|nr:Probable carboxylesterase 9 [Striga hermonthica]
MSKFDPYDHLNVSLNPDGSLTRFIKLPTSAATDESPHAAAAHSALSRDAQLDPTRKTWVRVYRPTRLPSNDTSVARLPIVVYFHPGGWVHMSIANTMIHEANNRMSAEIPAIVVAVEFRLAPESRLPAQYEDAVEAVTWVRDQLAAGRDGGAGQWIRDYGDFSRCYLYGVSCGANIAFNAALRIQELDLKPLTISGIILNQPFFGSKQRTKSELKSATDPYFPLPVQDLLWELALPVGTDRDHRFCNPFADKPTRDKVKRFGRCLVIGFGGDPLVDRQQAFVQMLVEEGVPVEARFDDVGFHGIDMIDGRRASAILGFIKEFV